MSKAEEIQDRLFAYAEVQQHADGRWSAQIVPELVAPFGLEPLPPGQCVDLGADGWDSYSILETYPPNKRGLHAQQYSGQHARDWAARPYFKSFEAARNAILRWLRENRKDLVETCAAEANAARRFVHPGANQ